LKETDEELVLYLKEEDSTSLPYRLKRIRFMVKAFSKENGYLVLPGGELSLHFFEEARLCYLNGQFIACVMLCQSLLEEIFRGLLRETGIMLDRDLNKAGFETLTEEALKHALITLSEAEAFHRLRSYRNKYVHPRPPSSVKWLPRRMLDEEKSILELTQADAQEALAIMFKTIKRQPFWVQYHSNHNRGWKQNQ